MEISDVMDSMYLAKTTTKHQFVSITYTIKLNRANPVKWICPYPKMISHEFFGHETCVLLQISKVG